MPTLRLQTARAANSLPAGLDDIRGRPAWPETGTGTACRRPYNPLPAHVHAFEPPRLA